MTPAHLELLRRLALADEVTLRAVTGGSPFESEPLDAVTHSLVIIAAVVALDPDGPSCHAAIDAALAAGAEDDAINDVISAIAALVNITGAHEALTACSTGSGHRQTPQIPA